MLGSNITIENMSHITSSFPLRTESISTGYIDRDFEGIHPTQLTKKKIKLQLLFVIPGEVSEDKVDFGDQEPENLPRVAMVRVPKGVPVAKLRNLIRHCEEQLHDIYGKSKRLNFVMTCDEDSDNWKYEFDLPTFGVVYV
jgi:hypothetical protein